MRDKKIHTLLKTLGPGLLYAGAAIGVSHLVQSTRAGAMFGFSLVWAILLANLFKYPFFEFGPRYASATGESLIDGYKRLGYWAVILFLIVTVLTMFTIQGAVTIVTAGIAMKIFPWLNISAIGWVLLLLGICTGVLVLGKYGILDSLMKYIIVVLAICTVTALIAALLYAENTSKTVVSSFNWSSDTDRSFLIALMGWMPAPIDIAIWHSLWTLAKRKDTGYKASLKESLFDFNIGYWGTVILAICFVSLGALVLHSSGQELSPKGAVFASQIIGIYTSSLGNWSYPIIAIAAFATMFSTTLTCLDAFPRVLRRTTEVLLPHVEEDKHRKLYWFWIGTVVSGAIFLLIFLKDNMTQFIDMATILSFLTAPILAYLNFKLVMSKHTPEEARPGKLLKAISIAGLVFLSAFSVLFLYWKYF